MPRSVLFLRYSRFSLYPGNFIRQKLGTSKKNTVMSRFCYIQVSLYPVYIKSKSSPVIGSIRIAINGHLRLKLCNWCIMRCIINSLWIEVMYMFWPRSLSDQFGIKNLINIISTFSHNLCTIVWPTSVWLSCMLLIKKKEEEEFFIMEKPKNLWAVATSYYLILLH